MDDIFDTILKLYGKPGIDGSYLPKLIRNKATGEVWRAGLFAGGGLLAVRGEQMR
jgi:hypothetical protein